MRVLECLNTQNNVHITSLLVFLNSRTQHVTGAKVPQLQPQFSILLKHVYILTDLVCLVR